MFLRILSVLGLAVLASCSSNRRAEHKILVTGSSTIAPLMAEIAKDFESRHGGFRIDVQTGGSSRGVSDARAGLSDLGMASRSAKPAESDLIWIPLARDGIALIVHRENPVRTLEDSAVAALFTGRTTDWARLGGTPGKVVVVHKAAGRSTQELFLAHFKLADSQIVADFVIGDNEQGIKTVAGNPQAVGYVSIGSAESAIRSGAPIAMVGTRAVQPSTTSVGDGTWPLSRTLHLVARDTSNAGIRKFLHFIRDPTRDSVVRRLGFVPMEHP